VLTAFIISLVLGIVNCQDIEINQTPIKLGKMLIDEQSIVLTGFSSGATFAQQLQFSYSSFFAGIAVFSSSFFGCGPGDGIADHFDQVCTKLENQQESDYFDPHEVLKEIRNWFEEGILENPIQLKDKRLYIYAGLKSYMFSPYQSFGILSVYEPYIKNPSAIRTRVQNSNLVFPTHNSYGSACDSFAASTAFIGNCGFSGAFEALSFLLPTKVKKEPSPGKKYRLRTLQTFDQTQFTKGIPNAQLDTAGYFYVPARCAKGVFRCPLNFYFHGCLTGREFNSTDHIVNSGFLETADLNDVITIFPQARATSPENEMGCWDTIGISGPLYATQKGDQVKAVKLMIDTILGKSKLG